MSAVLGHLARIREDIVKSPVPGDIGLDEMCDNARTVAKLCDLIGVEFRGAAHLIAMLEGASEAGVPLEVMVEDPDARPYIWDIEEK